MILGLFVLFLAAIIGAFMWGFITGVRFGALPPAGGIVPGAPDLPGEFRLTKEDDRPE
jgi:hypothetical protein